MRSNKLFEMLMCVSVKSYSDSSYFFDLPNRYVSWCVLEVAREGHCLCGWWKTAHDQRSSADCGTLPTSPRQRKAGDALSFLSTDLLTGTANQVAPLTDWKVIWPITAFGKTECSIWICNTVKMGHCFIRLWDHRIILHLKHASRQSIKEPANHNDACACVFLGWKKIHIAFQVQRHSNE